MEFQYESHEIYLLDDQGKKIAQITFPALSEDTVEIDHTFVDDSLRGQGVAGKLMEAAVAHIKAQGKQIKPTCSYAVKWLEKHPEWDELLAK